MGRCRGCTRTARSVVTRARCSDLALRDPCGLRGEAEFKRHLDDWDRQLREIRAGKRAHLDTWNQLTYDLQAIARDDGGRVQLHCKLGTNFHSLSTSECLDPELLEAFAVWPDSKPDAVLARLERQAWLHERVPDPVVDGPGPLGGHRRLHAHDRSGAQPGFRRVQDVLVAPLGHGRHPAAPLPRGALRHVPAVISSECSELLRSQFSVSETVMREFVEELYGVEELKTGDGQVDPQAIYRRREARLLSGMLRAGDAALLYSGLAVNLLALSADDAFSDPKKGADALAVLQVPADREFLFLFDYGDEWHFGVKLTGTGQSIRPGVSYPRLVATHGNAPPQYPEIDGE
jgi:hypothetical protein